MKQSRKVLEALLVIGLILIIPLFFAFSTKANAPATPNTVEPVLPTIADAPEESNTLKPKQPPACTFPLAEIKAEESKLEEYIFLEPTVMIVEPDNVYDIVEWLPDNRQVLMTKDLNNDRENGELLRQSIELYNPETGKSKIYATRFHIEQLPSWQSELNAVIYPAMNFLGFEENENKLKFTRQVWVSYGNPDTTQILADNLPQFSLAVKPNGNTMLYLENKKISKRDSLLKSISSVDFDLSQWDYSKRKNDNVPSYKAAWQPGTPLIFLYSDGNSRLDGYTFVLNSETGQVCELDLGGWAIKARWSPDGRYLAIVRTYGSFPIHSSDLAVLDTTTGDVYIANVVSQKQEGKQFVDDFVWAPDNHHLLAIGSLLPYQQTDQSADMQSRLYLVNFISGQSDDILPTSTFYASPLKGNLAWSLDGSKVLVRCPTAKDEQICLVTVHRDGQ